MPPVSMFDRLRYIESYFADTLGKRVTGQSCLVLQMKVHFIRYCNKFMTGILIHLSQIQSFSWLELTETAVSIEESFTRIARKCTEGEPIDEIAVKVLCIFLTTDIQE